jgi:nitrous oxidase accessory protein
VSCGFATTIYAGQNIQVALDEANPGDIIEVKPGEFSPFEVNKPLILKAQGAAIYAGVQRPAITVNSDNVSISGFLIQGVGEDFDTKFSFYMNNPLAAATKLNLPNAAIIVNSNNFSIDNSTILGSQVGIYSNSISSAILKNCVFDGCQTGVEFLNCIRGCIENCTLINCDKAGLDIDGCNGFTLRNNRVSKTNNAGIMLKQSELCEVSNNLFSENMEGLVLWNSTLINVSKNIAESNSYGILISKSNNNTFLSNLLYDNRQSKIVKGFGVGISLQENSSINILAGNLAKTSFNGLEVLRGCKYNMIFGNNISDNVHGIRMDKCKNNLIYGNYLIRNKINAYENSSRNIWNTTYGNFYSDYRGEDENGDGIGDTPYYLPGENSESSDVKPLMQLNNSFSIDVELLRAEAMNSTYNLHDNDAKLVSMAEGTIVIQYKKPREPPRWPKAKPLF